MADHDTPDDPFLERRLMTLAVLPVPDRPSVDDLAGRAGDGELPGGPSADQVRRRSHRLWLLTGAAAAAVLVVAVSIAAVVRSPDEEVAATPAAVLLDPDGPLVGVRWEVESIVVDGALTALPIGGQIVFAARAGFPDTLDYFGNDGCNDFSGSIRWQDGEVVSLEWGHDTPLAVCPGGDDNAAIRSVIESTDLTFVVDGPRLTAINGDRALIFRAAPPAPPITEPEADPNDTLVPGTTVPIVDPSALRTGIDAVAALFGARWDLEWVVVDGVRSNASEFEGYRPVWLRFSGDSERVAEVVDGADKCGDFRGDVVVLASTIQFEPTLYVVDVPCNLSLTPVDAAMAAVLSGEASYATDGTTLIITNGSSSLELHNAGTP